MVDYIANNTWLLWAAAFLIFGVIEMFTLELTAAAIAVSAVASLLVSLSSVSFIVEVVVFAAVAIALLVFVRPPVIRLVRSKTSHDVTNIDAIVGLRGQLVDSSIPGELPLVRLENGETWTLSVQPQGLGVGALVRVIEVRGASVVVSADIPTTYQSKG